MGFLSALLSLSMGIFYGDSGQPIPSQGLAPASTASSLNQNGLLALGLHAQELPEVEHRKIAGGKEKPSAPELPAPMEAAEEFSIPVMAPSAAEPSSGSMVSTRNIDPGKDCGSSGCHDHLAISTGGHSRLSADCGTCHVAAGEKAEHQFGFAAMAAEPCLDCHDREMVRGTGKGKVANITAQIANSKFKHGPVQMGDCQSCHLFHSSANASLLREPYSGDFYQPFGDASYALCFRCHDQGLAHLERTTAATAFRNGDQNLHYLHVNREKGRSCRVCHEIHASDLPGHIRMSVPFGSKGWELPISFQKAADGGTCSPGCHRPKAYGRQMDLASR